MQANLVGPTGATGSTGATGAAGSNGATWYTGSGAPGSSTGVVNDLYLNTANGDYYTKTGSSTWTKQGTLIGSANVSGTTNYITKMTSSTVIGNSQLYDDGTNVGLN